MTTELTYLAWTLVLALVQVLLPSVGRVRQLGGRWNAGPRDEPPPPPGRYTGRLERALRNLFETLPVFIGLVLIAHLAGREGGLTRLGTALYFWARLVYVPLYASGITGVRSLAWGVSFAGLILIAFAVLRPA